MNNVTIILLDHTGVRMGAGINLLNGEKIEWRRKGDRGGFIVTTV